MKNMTFAALPIFYLSLAGLAGAATELAPSTVSVRGDLTVDAGDDILAPKTISATGTTSSGDPDFDLLKTAPPVPPSPPPAGDPDFDLLRIAPPPPAPPTGDPDFDLLRIAPPPAASSKNKDFNKEIPIDSNDDDTEAGKTTSATGGGPSMGDPDFDLLNIDIGGDNLKNFRDEVSSGGTDKKVTVRGWDPEKKEEIIGKPEEVKTAEDLKTYVEAVALNDTAIEGIKINENELEVESREPGKLFWFIPVEMSSVVTVKYNLQDTSGDPADIPVTFRLPWWHIFVKKASSPGAFQTELSTGLSGAEWQKVDNSDSPVLASRVSRTLRLVSSVLKTRHDTAKNSISNVR